MPGPLPTYRPPVTLEQVRDCERLVRQQNAPQVQVARAKLALLLHAQPDLDSDALKPWQHQSWLYPRDPQFAVNAGRVLDLYAGWWAGAPLGPADCLISADEKTSIQARVRIAPTTPPRPGQPMRVEHEYERGGALAYLAAWDVRRGGAGALRAGAAARRRPASSRSGCWSRR